ncbi:unnamed protein product [Rangifer tarandus platyrhynchus]|uniref:Uncharacterized protein n=1 Tax=Rangifer tarandus platyrhynchus TaxID=3082113 RepID=A0ABN8XIZ1_RANTA|nr:unnamed protein product [Rangifer tarandus platyrhynchus]
MPAAGRHSLAYGCTLRQSVDASNAVSRILEMCPTLISLAAYQGQERDATVTVPLLPARTRHRSRERESRDSELHTRKGDASGRPPLLLRKFSIPRASFLCVSSFLSNYVLTTARTRLAAKTIAGKSKKGSSGPRQAFIRAVGHSYITATSVSPVFLVTYAPPRKQRHQVLPTAAYACVSVDFHSDSLASDVVLIPVPAFCARRTPPQTRGCDREDVKPVFVRSVYGADL